MTTVGYVTKCFAVKTVYVSPTSSTELHSILNKRLKNRLKIERRSTNNFQHIGSRRLLLGGLLQVACARLHLLEQPRVLDGDHRLVGEGLHQGDVIIGKQSNFGSSDEDYSQQLVGPEHRN